MIAYRDEKSILVDGNPVRVKIEIDQSFTRHITLICGCGKELDELEGINIPTLTSEIKHCPDCLGMLPVIAHVRGADPVITDPTEHWVSCGCGWRYDPAADGWCPSCGESS